MDKRIAIMCRMRKAALLALVVGLMWVAGPAAGSAQPPPQVRITSDRLSSDNDTRIIEFSGNVKAIRGDTTITADRLLIYPYDNVDGRSEDRSWRKMVRKVVAEGQVIIRRGDFTATTPQAAYDTRQQTIELKGAGTRVVSGKNVLTGNKMTLQLEKERIRVTGIDDQRVKAVFRSP